MIAKLDPARRAGLPAILPAWTHDTQADTLTRVFRFADFSAAWGFMARVALLAQQHDHHPDWSNSYATVTIALTTHDAGGLSERDTALARAIDALL